MSQEQTVRMAQQLLAHIGSGAAPEEIAGIFSVDLQFEVPADIGALSWVGSTSGRSAVSDFIRGTRRLLKRIRFEVTGIMANGNRAVIVGDLISKVKATGKIIESLFALILRISAGKIARFQMLEDSFAVVQAARP